MKNIELHAEPVAYNNSNFIYCRVFIINNIQLGALMNLLVMCFLFHKHLNFLSGVHGSLFF